MYKYLKLLKVTVDLQPKFYARNVAAYEIFQIPERKSSFF